MSGDRVTARAILIHGRDVLLMHRRRGSEEYHVLPGGGIEGDETPLEACRREIHEETGLDVSHLRAVDFDDTIALGMHLFWAEVTDTRVQLGGPEASRSNPYNRYELVWVTIEGLAGIVLRPFGLKSIVMKVMKTRSS